MPTGDTLCFLDAAGSLYAARESDWAPVHLGAGLTPAGAEPAMA
jgi:hypothetical protein